MQGYAIVIACACWLGFGIGIAVAWGVAARKARIRSVSSTDELSERRARAALRLDEAARDLHEAQVVRDNAVRAMRQRERCLMRRSHDLVELDRELGRRGEPTVVA